MKIATWNVNGIRARHAQVQEWISASSARMSSAFRRSRPHPDRHPGCFFAISKATGATGTAAKGYSGVAPSRRPSESPPIAARSRIPHSTTNTESSRSKSRPPSGPSQSPPSTCPNGGKDFPAKMRFLRGARRIRRVVCRPRSRLLVLCGDLNVARDGSGRPPQGTQAAVRSDSFPEERALLERIIGRGLVDVGRALDPDNDGLFTWWAPWRNLRQRNIGWRLDYVLASTTLARARPQLSGASVMCGTSDHAPVFAVFEPHHLQ